MTRKDIRPGSAEYRGLFSSVTTSAFRLETLQAYDVPAEHDAFRRFAAGEAQAKPDLSDWCDRVRRAAVAGCRYSRVHVVTEPLTAYIRFELAAYADTSAAGEQIMIVPVREGSWPARLPRADFWLFDDSVLLNLAYNQAGQLTGASVIDSGNPVEEARRIREEAISLAVPYADYAAGLGS